jgi:hypothetical protein
VTSVLTIAEARRALVRSERQGAITAAATQRLQGMLPRASAGWMLMEVTAGVLARAGAPFPAEPLRTLEAIHLSTALEFLQVFEDLELLSYDQWILANARPLGITALEPGV